jgi:glutaminase-like protein
VVVDPWFDGRPAHVQPLTGVALAKCPGQFAMDVADLAALNAREACGLYDEIFRQESMCPYKSGLPFRYSHAFCEVVAHAVRRCLQAKGLTVGKAWAFAKPRQAMTIQTTSRRSCQDRWWQHVAVVARSADAAGDLWVFDPNSRLERGVASFAEWKQTLGPNLGRVHLRRADAYCLEPDDRPDVDLDAPCFREGDDDELDEALDIARCTLGCFAAHYGRPPFDDCKGFPKSLPDCSKLTPNQKGQVSS